MPSQIASCIRSMRECCVIPRLILSVSYFSSFIDATWRGGHFTLHDLVSTLLQLDLVVYQRFGLQADLVVKTCDGVVDDLAVEVEIFLNNFDHVKLAVSLIVAHLYAVVTYCSYRFEPPFVEHF